MSKGEIDILLNPHNLLIKIVISFRYGAQDRGRRTGSGKKEKSVNS